jgi:hypothetical protein
VYLKAELLATGHFASGRSCGRPTRSRLSWFSSVPEQNAELVTNSHVALNASHAALSMLIRISHQSSPSQLLSSAHKACHFLTLYLLHFPKLYPISEVYLPEGWSGSVWETSKQERIFCPFPSCCHSLHLPHHFLILLSLSLSAVLSRSHQEPSEGTVSEVRNLRNQPNCRTGQYDHVSYKYLRPFSLLVRQCDPSVRR